MAFPQSFQCWTYPTLCIVRGYNDSDCRFTIPTFRILFYKLGWQIYSWWLSSSEEVFQVWWQMKCIELICLSCPFIFLNKKILENKCDWKSFTSDKRYPKAMLKNIFGYQTHSWGSNSEARLQIVAWFTFISRPAFILFISDLFICLYKYCIHVKFVCIGSSYSTLKL